MDLAKYPHAGWWLDSIQRNEAGMIIILLIALAVVGLLIDMRWIWPKLMPYLRIAVVGVFYLSFIVFLIAGKP